MQNTNLSAIQQIDDLDPALRPQTLAEFIGQDHLKANLRVFIEASKSRTAAMDHVLLYGPPGLGKTTMAQIIAKELGVGFRATSGPIITKAGDLAAILTNLQPNDVLFIDEIHRLNATVEEVLYPAMEDGKLDLMIGEGPAARSVQIDLQPFTLVAATTRSGLLATPLRERFGIPLRLEFYEPAQLAKIVTRTARLLETDIDEEGALEIAKRSRGTPRVAGRLTRRVRDFAVVDKQTLITKAIADAALSRLDVDDKGLDGMDKRYMRLIADNYGGGPVGIDTMSAALSEQRDVIEETVEPYLLQQGFIQRTPRGRCLTKKAYEHLGLNTPKTLEADLFDQ
ncbi:MAG: Holliday junction branch migration DNA helicase RuvB [Micavibrio sp.]|nr:Holliday junction branch migration DNA helicase RuvB [Micavibrio sp.]|tara:strand:- start:6543 stop:7562 length:1020 start_codon:yes stop_codon:yes gene_type:complete